MENAGYIFAAFAIIWVLVFVYVFILTIRQKQLKQELVSIQERLKESRNDN
ncbi:MAG: CcmD family protein [Planctomycetota bacterium]|jgi:CcmD family protein